MSDERKRRRHGVRAMISLRELRVHLRDLCTRATPGPWNVLETTRPAMAPSTVSSMEWSIGTKSPSAACLLYLPPEPVGHPDVELARANAALVVGAVNAIPALLDALQDAETEIERLLDAPPERKP